MMSAEYVMVITLAVQIVLECQMAVQQQIIVLPVMQTHLMTVFRIVMEPGVAA